MSFIFWIPTPLKLSQLLYIIYFHLCLRWKENLFYFTELILMLIIIWISGAQYQCVGCRHLCKQLQISKTDTDLWIELKLSIIVVWKLESAKQAVGSFFVQEVFEFGISNCKYIFHFFGSSMFSCSDSANFADIVTGNCEYAEFNTCIC